MHVITVGVEKKIKERVVHMISDKMRPTSAIRTINNMKKQVRSIKSTFKRVINEFPKDTVHKSSRYGTKLDYSQGECQSPMPGIYKETETQRML